MSGKKRPYFRIESRMQDGPDGEPQLYNLEQVRGDWHFSRRGFLATAAALAALGAGVYSGGRVAAENSVESGKGRLKSHLDKVTAVAFSPDGKLLASASRDKTIKLWDPGQQQLLRTLRGHAGAVTSTAFSPDSRMLASGSEDKTVRLWETAGGSLLKIFKKPSGSVLAVAFSPDGKWIAAAGQSKELLLFEVSSGNELGTLRGHTHPVRAVLFSRDGKILVSAGQDHLIKIWDPVKRTCLKTITESLSFQAVALSPEADLIAAAGSDRKALLLETVSGRIRTKFEGHHDDIYAIAFSPAGVMLATAGADRTVRLWDALTGYCTQTLEGHKGDVLSVAFSPDGRWLASAGADRTVRLWSGPEAKQIAVLFDPAATDSNQKAVSFHYTNEYGQVLTRTLPCGAPIPAGAVCTCNCVPGTYKIAVPSGGGSSCMCNQICSCIPIV